MKNLSQHITESFNWQHPTLPLDQGSISIENEQGPFKLSEEEKIKLGTVFLVGSKGLTNRMQRWPNLPAFFNSGYKGISFHLNNSNLTYCLIYNPGKVHAEDHQTGSFSLVQGRNTIWSVSVNTPRDFGDVGLEPKHFKEATDKFKKWLKEQKK